MDIIEIIIRNKFNKNDERLKKVNILRKHSHVHFYVLILALIAYLSFCFIFLFVFPNQYFVSDFNIRFSSLVVETIVLISLLYSIVSRKVKLGVFWASITIAIGCFLIGILYLLFKYLM